MTLFTHPPYPQESNEEKIFALNIKLLSQRFAAYKYLLKTYKLQKVSCLSDTAETHKQTRQSSHPHPTRGSRRR